MKETNMKLYGVENVYQNDLIKEKIGKTNLKKFGVLYPAQSPNYKQSFYNKIY